MENEERRLHRVQRVQSEVDTEKIRPTRQFQSVPPLSRPALLPDRRGEGKWREEDGEEYGLVERDHVRGGE